MGLGGADEDRVKTGFSGQVAGFRIYVRVSLSPNLNPNKPQTLHREACQSPQPYTLRPDPDDRLSMAISENRGP